MSTTRKRAIPITASRPAPDNGIAPGTLWKDVPDDFTCPLCGVGKEDFSAE